MGIRRFKLRGTSTGKSIKWDSGHDELWNIQLQAYKGYRIEVTIGRETKSNSGPQQRYYRGVIVPTIAQQLGYTNNECHGVLQYKFFTETDDNGLTRIRSTKQGEWTTVEWEKKMTEIRMWCQEQFGLYIPLPNETEEV